MTDSEKKDMLILELAMLYSIKEANKEENAVLDRHISITEQRLVALGYNDFNKLK